MMSNNTKPAIALIVMDVEKRINKMGYKKVSSFKYLRPPENITGELVISASADRKKIVVKILWSDGKEEFIRSYPFY